MAYDKVVDSSVLDAGLKAIADAIREKGGTSDNLAFPDAMAAAIAAIEAGGGGGVQIATGTYTPTEEVTVSSNYSFEHNAGFIPRLFVMYDSDYERTSKHLHNVLILKNTSIEAEETSGAGIAQAVTYSASTYSQAVGSMNFNAYKVYFSTINHNEQYVTFTSYSGGIMAAGHKYVWYAFSDWGEISQ